MSEYVKAKSIAPGIYNGFVDETQEVLHIIMPKKMSMRIRRGKSISLVARIYIKKGMEREKNAADKRADRKRAGRP